MTAVIVGTLVTTFIIIHRSKFKKKVTIVKCITIMTVVPTVTVFVLIFFSFAHNFRFLRS